MTARSSMLAITRSRPWQRAHMSISIANTCFRRCAQLFSTGRGVAHLPAPYSAPFPPGPRRAGVIAARRWLRVALDRRALAVHRHLAGAQVAKPGVEEPPLADLITRVGLKCHSA